MLLGRDSDVDKKMADTSTICSLGSYSDDNVSSADMFLFLILHST